MKKLLEVELLKIHSAIDVITNSSSEIFINDVKCSSKEILENIISDILKEFGCDAVDLFVEQEEDWDTPNLKAKIIPNMFNIYYDYETHSGEPCKLLKNEILKRIGELNAN
jgi:hypothetical protein